MGPQRTPRSPQTAAVGTHTPPAHHTYSTAAAGTGTPSRQLKLEPGVPPVAGWGRTHVARTEGGPVLATEQRQAQRHSRATPMPATCVPGRLVRTHHQACGSRSASSVEAARREMGLARRATGAACADACVGMASCILVWAPELEPACIVVDRSRGHKACHLRPGRRRASSWVLARGHRCKGRHIQALVGVARKSFEGVEVGSARGARPLAQ